MKNMKKKCIGVMGSSQIEHIIPLLETEYNVVNIQKVLDDEHNRILRLLKFIKAISKVDILYKVFVEGYFWKKIRIAHFFHKKVYGHWIGTDARLAATGHVDINKINELDGHITCFQPLQKQLESIGIESVVIPIVPFKVNFEVGNMPLKHRVLIYMPRDKEEEYGFNEIYPIIKEFSNIEFDIVANDNKEKFGEVNNVKLLGWLDHDKMEEVYDKISIVIRIHFNDGLSMSVLEAMAKGKKVIWNCSFEKCYPGSTTDEIRNSLKQIIKEEPAPKTDIDAHDFIIENYSKEKILSMYREIFG